MSKTTPINTIMPPKKRSKERKVSLDPVQPKEEIKPARISESEDDTTSEGHENRPQKAMKNEEKPDVRDYKSLLPTTCKNVDEVVEKCKSITDQQKSYVAKKYRHKNDSFFLSNVFSAMSLFRKHAPNGSNIEKLK